MLSRKDRRRPPEDVSPSHFLGYLAEGSRVCHSRAVVCRSILHLNQEEYVYRVSYIDCKVETINIRAFLAMSTDYGP